MTIRCPTPYGTFESSLFTYRNFLFPLCQSASMHLHCTAVCISTNCIFGATLGSWDRESYYLGCKWNVCMQFSFQFISIITFNIYNREFFVHVKSKNTSWFPRNCISEKMPGKSPDTPGDCRSQLEQLLVPWYLLQLYCKLCGKLFLMTLQLRYFLPSACLAIAAVPPANITRKVSTQSSNCLLESSPCRSAMMPVCDIMRFGAVAGNNTVDAPANAHALRSALTNCQHVVIPSGNVFKISPVAIPSNRILELQEGTVGLVAPSPNYRFTHDSKAGKLMMPNNLIQCCSRRLVAGGVRQLAALWYHTFLATYGRRHATSTAALRG